LFCFTADSPDFWIQLKGENAGRPLASPCVNSVGVKADQNILVPQFLYYQLLHVYQSGIYRSFLKGSVIPYIRQGDILRAYVQTFAAAA
jgi:hypothetical protein